MSQELIFERIDKGWVYFKDKENKTIVLPENYVNNNLVKGDKFFIDISKDGKHAKDILNELLSPENK